MAKDIARSEINRVNAQIKQGKPANAQAFAALATGGRLTSNDSGWFGTFSFGGVPSAAPIAATPRNTSRALNPR